MNLYLTVLCISPSSTSLSSHSLIPIFRFFFLLFFLCFFFSIFFSPFFNFFLNNPVLTSETGGKKLGLLGEQNRIFRKRNMQKRLAPDWPVPRFRTETTNCPKVLDRASNQRLGVCTAVSYPTRCTPPT